ncbi:hypothetical protein C1646_746796 [Rhizophagus diaphanus]|nr:hypothetical protein C1646_746796 [Rhizophagus diaphanus] [Rhizophagus sp. MUCL 43196]
MVFDHNLSEYCEEFKTLYNDCINDYQNNIGIKNNYDVNGNKLIGLVILCIFQVTFMIIVALLWQKRYWNFLPEFALTTREEIKLDYEVEPIEFEYKDDPLLDQDTDDENV